MSEQAQGTNETVVGVDSAVEGGDQTVTKPRKQHVRTGVTQEAIVAAYHDAKNATLADVAAALGMNRQTLSVRLTSYRKKGLLNRTLERSANKAANAETATAS